MTEVFGHEALEEPKNKNKLTCLAKRSAEAYEEGTFLEARAQGVISKRKRRPTGKISGAAPVAVVLYDWYKKLPPHARKTRQLFYKKVLHLYEEHRQGCAALGETPQKCGGVRRQHRREWLDA